MKDIEVFEEIAHGSQSVVYRVRSRGRTLALKTPRGHANPETSAANSERFFREAAALARARHPGLPEIVDVGVSDDGTSYLLMEFVDGSTLADRIARAPLQAHELKALAETLAGALAAVHQLGLVHRDIKPQNVLLSSAGEAKLIDFGFATQALDEKAGEHQLTGTLLYASPEQNGTLKRPVDGRSDLYSLGVVLYECAAGAPPFQASTAAGLIQQHASAVPRPLSSLSAALAAIIAKLLAKDPDDRYQSARGLLADLKDLARLEASAAPVLGASDDFIESINETILVGRDGELAAVDRCWREARSGRGSAVLVAGEPGSGKSRLIRELVSRADSKSSLVLKGKCRQGNPIPFAPLREAFEDHLRRLERLPPPEAEARRQELRSAAGEYAPYLKRLTPGLARLLAESRDAQVENEELFHAGIVQVLQRLAAARGTLILVIDDVQWLDHASLKTLSLLAGRFSAGERGDAVPILLACTGRNDPDSLPALKHFVQEVGEKRLSMLSLEPLPERSVGELVRLHLGDQEVKPVLVEQIFLRCRGNPFAAGEYVRAMLDRGLLRPSWGSWSVDLTGLESLHLPTDVIQLVVKRMSALSPGAKFALRAAALLGVRFRLDLLPEICGLKPGEVTAAISESTQGGLLERSDAAEYAFVHDRVQEAALAGSEAEELAQIHQAIAEAMDRAGSEDAFALARHYHAGTARNPARVRETLLAAGAAALAGSAYREAHAFHESAFAFCKANGLELGASEKRAFGTACMSVNRFPEAIELLKEALAGTTDPIERARLRDQIGRAHVALNHFAEGERELIEGFRELGVRPPGPSLVTTLSAILSFAWGKLVSATGIGFGSARGRERDRLVILSQLYEGLGLTFYVQAHPLLPVQPMGWLVGITHRIGPSPELTNFLAFYGIIVPLFGMKKRFLKSFDRAIRLAEQLGDPQILGHVISYRGIGAVHSGLSRQADEIYHGSVRKHDGMMLLGDLLNVNGSYSNMLSIRGRTRELFSLITRVQARVREIQGHDDPTESNIWNYTFSMLSHAIHGDSAEAIRLLRCVERIPNLSLFSYGIHLSNLILFHVETRELGEPLEKTIETYRRLGFSPALSTFFWKHFYIFTAYARLLQAQSGPASGRPAAVRRLRQALGELRIAAFNFPIPTCYLHIFTAGELRLRGTPGARRRARKHLARAEALAVEHDIPFGHFEIAVARAHLARDEGHVEGAAHYARCAHQLAVETGWAPRARRVREAFPEAFEGLSSPGTRTTGGSTYAGSAHLTATQSQSPMLQRHLDALLQLGLASASVLNPDQQCRIVLEQIVRILGAERAFLFLADPRTGELALKAGCDAEGRALQELRGYSSTVVKQSFAQSRPMIVSGTDEGAVLGSESAVTHSLRSIMAAPVKLRDRLIGVVYLDSRVARGIFGESDVEILVALSNHIAVAIETARSAQMEIEKKSLERDLEVSAAVQSLLIPSQRSIQDGPLRLASFYRPASTSGGDWYEYQRLADGRLRVFIGDVTGHGVGAAMVTAIVASSFQANRGSGDGAEAGVQALIEAMNRSLHGLCQGKYFMSLLAVEIDPARRTLRYWNAGHPSAFYQPPGTREASKIQTLSSRGTPLGSEKVDIGAGEMPFEPGAKVFLFTDCAYELKPRNGSRGLGLKGLRDWFAESSARAAPGVPDELREQLVERFDSCLAGGTQEDDLTFVIVENAEV